MKKDYMARLERAARWRLPPKEADDVIADYREMVGDPPRPEEELLRELGKPWDAVRPLTQKWPYRFWLAVFAFLSLCILSFGISVYDWHLWLIYFDDHIHGTEYYISYVVTVLGTVTAMMWFHQQGRKGARLPMAIPILLAVLLACCGGVMLYCWAGSRDFESFATMWGTYTTWIGPNSVTPISTSVHLPLSFMADGSVIIAIAGVFWLVKARTVDRRWAAVYIMALTFILAALNVVAAIYSMDPTFMTIEELYRQQLLQSAGITAVGLIGMGVALC